MPSWTGRLVALLALLAAPGPACAGGMAGAPGGGADSGPAAACTGALPANATPCPGSDVGLTSDTLRCGVTTCDCVPPCAAARCSYVCNPGYALRDGGCESEPVTLPGAQVVDNGDGTVTVEDHFARLVWLRDASCAETVGGVARPGGLVSWWGAGAWAAGLAAGACGLQDGSAPGDWRVPEPTELTHLMSDLGLASPFQNTQPGPYWSSYCHHDYCAAVQGGQVAEYPADTLFSVWTVRR